MIYGEPRLTNDVDLVVVLDVDAIPRLESAFPSADFYCPPAEVLRVEVHRGHRGHFNIIHHETGFKADVYIAGRDPLHRWALSHRRALTVGAATVHVAPPEYVIVRKLEYFREGQSHKHVDDIRHMLDHLGDRLDSVTLEKMIAERGLGVEWAIIRARRATGD